MRPCLTKILPGRHVLHFHRSNVVRYYAEIDVKRGENTIEPKLEYFQMPSLSRRLVWGETPENRLRASEKFTYPVYDAENRKRTDTMEIELSIEIRKDAAQKDRHLFQYDWRIIRNQTVISQGRKSDTGTEEDSETRRFQQVLSSDPIHNFFISYYISSLSTEFTAGGEYKNLP